jgi:hypothetical protein
MDSEILTSEPYRISVIEGLVPYGLGDVYGAGDKQHHKWRDRHSQWKLDVLRLRDKVSELADFDPEFRQAELELCAKDPAYWLTMYAWIEEPRTVKGEPNVKPFIPFEFQVRLLQEFVAMVEDPEPRDLYVSKARGLGASWLFCAAAYWGWLFKPWRGKLVSRNQQLVDAPLDLDSLFGKVDFLVDWTPQWMLPGGFSRKLHRRELMLMNPVSGARLAGESTTSMTARGARSTYSIYDEAAFIRDFPEVWATGEATSTHRVGLSTESFTVGRGWYDTWNEVKNDASLRHQLIELEWWENVYQDQNWYELTLARTKDLEKFRREYERNPYEGSGQFIYEIAREMRFDERLLFDPTEPLLISMDPGHADDTAIVWGQQIDEYGSPGIRFLGSYERNYAPVEWYAHLLTGIIPIPGDKCWGMDMTDREKYDLFPFFEKLPWTGDRVQVFMDPAGAQKHAGQSFFDLFVDATFKLRERRYAELVAQGETPKWKPAPIIPMYQAIKGVKNHHEERRNSTRQYLPFSDVNSTIDGQRIRTCLINYQMSSLTDHSTSEMKPIHSKFSHIVTACEYLFSYMAMGFLDIGADFYFAPPPRVPLDFSNEEDSPWTEPGMQLL